MTLARTRDMKVILIPRALVEYLHAQDKENFDTAADATTALASSVGALVRRAVMGEGGG